MKGILFKPWKIKAIAEDDREWQTRRVIKPQPTKPFGTAHDWEWKPAGMLCYDDYFRSHAPNYARYQVGEVVYIKEELLLNPIYGEAGYRDGSPVFIYNDELGKTRHILKWRWRSDVLSSRCMPREAARYFIKITDIRAERLQEISEEDIKAEGFDSNYTKIGYYYVFGQRWNQINPKYPWESNPWVFVYSFKKAEK